jgi:hypothetical protein
MRYRVIGNYTLNLLTQIAASKIEPAASVQSFGLRTISIFRHVDAGQAARLFDDEGDAFVNQRIRDIRHIAVPTEREHEIGTNGRKHFTMVGETFRSKSFAD